MCHSTRWPALGQRLAGDVEGIDRDQVVGLAVDEQDGRAGGRPPPGARGRRAGRRSRPRRRARAERRSPTCSASMVPWLKPTSTRRFGASR